MTRSAHCSCTRPRRDWLPDGTCARCRLTVHETDLMRAIKAILISDPACLLWRNEIGYNTHFPDGRKRDRPIEYGVCNPGGADMLGCFGPRLLAVETKTVRGALSPHQRKFGQWLATRGNVYAVPRSELDAHQLLAWLRGQGERPGFVFAAATMESP